MPKVVDDQRIFRAVIETIAAQGYTGATTKQIAETADISEVTLFRRYGTKAEMVKRAIAALLDESDFESATRYTGRLRADLLRVLQAYQDTVVLHGTFFFSIATEVSRTPELADALALPLSLFQSVSELLARYQAQGMLKPESPRHGVAALLGPLIYISIIEQSGAGSPLPPLLLTSHTESFLFGHGADPRQARCSQKSAG